MEKLSQILWRERELLSTLLYRLELEQMVLASGRTRWLMRSAHEVETVLTTIRETEILRSVAADQVAAWVGLSSNPTLRALSEACDEPWRSILADHHEAFVRITQEIGALADANRDLIRAEDQARITASISGLDGDRSQFTTTRADAGSRQIRIEAAFQAAGLQLEQAAYQASLAATSRVTQPSLLDFLRSRA